MPFRSERQRRALYAKNPKLAKKFSHHNKHRSKTKPKKRKK